MASPERGGRGELAGEACRASARAHPALTSLAQRAEYAAYRAGSLVGRALPVPVASAIARATQPLLAGVYRGRTDMTAMARARAVEQFGQVRVRAAYDSLYRALMTARSRPVVAAAQG